MNWVFLCLLSISVSLVVADLPSCTRARCVHCEVEFIGRMCPTACAACHQQRPAQVGDARPPQPPITWHPVKNSGSVQPKPVNPVRQAGVQTQTYHQVPQPQYQPQQAQAFAAPVQQYPASTLAPLIEQPNPNQLNPQLANRPADLAHPLPEYQRPGFNQNFNQQPQQPQYNYQPQGQQPFQQNFYQQGQGQQTGQGFYPQQPQQSQFFNPFQPFLQNSFQGAANPLDPLGLFNFGGQNTFTHAAPVAQVAQPSARTYPSPSSAAAASAAAGAQSRGPATAFNGNYNAQPTYPVAQQAPAAQQAPQAAPAVQQPTQVQPSLQLPQMPSLFTPPSVPPSPPAPATIALQSQGQYRTNQAPAQTAQQAQPVQQPAPQAQQPLPQQPAQYQQPPQQTQPLPPTSNSIDSAPSFYGNKYYGEKGPAPAPPPAQCPRAGWEPCISKDVANERFRNCCARLGDGCSQLCNYDANLATMQLAVLTGRCPLNKVADMMVCASGYEDATPCCEAYNVFEPGYEQCRPYCNPAAGLPQGGPLSDKYKCLVKLGAIQQCFYVTQKP